MKDSKAKRTKTGGTKRDGILVALTIALFLVLAVPVYDFCHKKVKSLECDPMLRKLRTTVLIYRAQHNTYPRSTKFRPIAEVGQIHFAPDVLEGKYFTSESYTYRSLDGMSFVIRAVGRGTSAGIHRQIDEEGDVSSF